MSTPPPFDADAFLAGLTHRPGVYRMLDSAGEILYVGKARNLKSRVTSYFRSGPQTAKTMALVEKIAAILVRDTAADSMLTVAIELLANEERSASLSKNIKQLAKPDAATRIAEEVLKLIDSQR